MIIGRVIGNIESIIKDDSFEGFKLMIVQEINLDGTYDKNFYISVDLIGVGDGEIVMVTNGTSSRATEETYEKPIDSIIIAKINKIIFKDREVDLE